MDVASLAQFRDWIGRTDVRQDVVTAAPLVALAALLDREDPPPGHGDPAPPLAHWLYFLPNYRQSDAGPDGHATKGSFMPPVPLPRRMWAGSRLEFLRPLRVGARIARLSRIKDVVPKEGRSGPLLFVTVLHEVSDEEGLVLTDEHDLVFRGPLPRGQDRTVEAALANAPKPAPAEAKWHREIRPDPVLLFRYSAVTFNSHRIHYDLPYATNVEGYPGLVVHGPLIATLLVDLLRRNRPDVVLRGYSFRALRPLYDTAPRTCGAPDESARTAELWTRDPEGAVTMEAKARW